MDTSSRSRASITRWSTPAAEFKCCPPIRDPGNQRELWQGLVADLVPRSSLPDAVTITPGIHIGSSPQLLRTLAERPKVQKALGGGPDSPEAADTATPVMVFGGYAGWGPGQLEAELQHKSWLPSFGEIDADLVFATAPDKVWEAALAAMALSPGHIVSGSGASA